MSSTLPLWHTLFTDGSPASSARPVTMKLLTKRGQPFLLLPTQPRLAKCALQLFPAQTPRARLARLAAPWVLAARLPFGGKDFLVQVSPDAPFVRWLAGLGDLPAGSVPKFAALAGNPNSPGQRLIILVFDKAGRAVSVVKIGTTDAARKLIERERQFLESAPSTVPGIPKVRASFSQAQLRAFALDFFPGRTPSSADETRLPEVLGAWLRPEHPVAFAQTRAWHDLSAACADHPLFGLLADLLRNQSSRAALYHGDFAPWNVRVSPTGAWTALDWERGELSGFPAWDWFHYTIQKSILVQHQRVEPLAAFLEVFLNCDAFQAYAQQSGIGGNARSLLLLYLLHHAEVVRPTEGLAETRDLLRHLAARWR